MSSKLLEVPRLRKLLPFVRKTYASPSCYKWADAEGHTHEIWQHEGGEQGDPPMPFLISLAIHNALAEVQGQMQDGEFLFAFLDDVYHHCQPQGRGHLQFGPRPIAHDGRDPIASEQNQSLEQRGSCPADLEDLGEEVWSSRGVKILGTPIGSQEFVRFLGGEQLQEEQRLWEAISWVPDLQSAWQILLQCAGPRCHHYVRTLPPSESQFYAEGHAEIRGTQDRHIAHEVGWARASFCESHASFSMLGVVGRFTADD